MDCKIDETPVITASTHVIYFLVFITIIRRTFSLPPSASRSIEPLPAGKLFYIELEL